MNTLVLLVGGLLLAGLAYYFLKKRKEDEKESDPTGPSYLTLRAGDVQTVSTFKVGAENIAATAVVVQFTSVELQPETGDRVIFSYEEPKFLNLTANIAGNTLVEGETVPAGKYEWIRLKAVTSRGSTDSYVEVNGEKHPLFIPSGAQSGLKLTQGFVMPEGEPADFTIDFNLEQSVHAPKGQDGYVMRPVLKLVDNYNPPEPPVEEPTEPEEPEDENPV